MPWELALVLLLAVLALLLLSGQWIAMALGTAGVFLLVLDSGFSRVGTIGSISYNSVANFVLTAIPLFLLMGQIILRSGLSTRFYRGVSTWMAGLPGTLLHSNIIASTIFAAISGSTVATGAAIGTVALPQMDRRGYDRRLTFSSLAGGGSVGMLIPPSIAALVYAALAEVSVSALFIAGVLPGLLLSLMYSCYIAFRVLRRPELAPSTDDRYSWGDRLRAIGDIAPLVSLILVVLGTIYLGVATPTEAAALGVTGAVVLSLIFGRLTPSTVADALVRSVRSSCMIVFIIVGAQVLSFSLVNSGITRELVSSITAAQLPPLAFIILLIVFYALLGMVVEGLSIMLLTLPLLYPIILELGYDPILFGVLLILFIELGQITPPVGLLLFVLRDIAPDSSINDVARAAVPICVCIIAVAVLIFYVPEIALWLPSLI